MAHRHWVALLLVLVLYSVGRVAAEQCTSVNTPLGRAIPEIRDELIIIKQQFNAEISTLKSRLSQAEGKLRNHEFLLKQKRNQVAFAARVAGNVVYAPNQVIKFPSIISNIGNRYNARTGQFTCGDSGLYVFLATILSGSRPTWFQIVQNGVVKSNGYSGDGAKQPATHVAVVRCSPNSRVWVRRTNFQRAYNHMVWEAHSEFSGFKFGD